MCIRDSCSAGQVRAGARRLRQGPGALPRACGRQLQSRNHTGRARRPRQGHRRSHRLSCAASGRPRRPLSARQQPQRERRSYGVRGGPRSRHRPACGRAGLLSGARNRAQGPRPPRGGTRRLQPRRRAWPRSRPGLPASCDRHLFSARLRLGDRGRRSHPRARARRDGRLPGARRRSLRAG